MMDTEYAVDDWSDPMSGRFDKVSPKDTVKCPAGGKPNHAQCKECLFRDVCPDSMADDYYAVKECPECKIRY